MPESVPSLVEKETIEQKPFEVPAVQNFMGEWCEIHDKSIKPTFVDRETWDAKRETGLIENGNDGKKNLYLTTDLQLWEMGDVIESIDTDTLGPEKGSEKAAQLKGLGKKFSDSGIYIAKRINSIHNGKPQATELAEKFYNYGQSLMTGWKTDHEADIEKISQLSLATDEETAVDRWLADEDVYRSQMAIVDRKMQHTDGSDTARYDLLEQQRERALNQFFYKVEDHSARYSRSPFLDKIQAQTKRAVETPKRELTTSITRRGMDLLKRSMRFDKLKDELAAYKAGEIDVSKLDEREQERLTRLETTIQSLEKWETAEPTLREGLQLDRLQLELELARETGDPAVISRKEEEIATRIQEVVSAYTYESVKSRPSQMIDEQRINCSGATLLAGTFLSELGIKYLVGSQPGHSQLISVTADGKVNIRDMLFPDVNMPVTEGHINGRKKNGDPVTLQDLRELSDNPQNDSLLFQVSPGDFFMASAPETGHSEQILGNVAATYLQQKQYDRAAEYYKEVTEINPSAIIGHIYLAKSLISLGREKEALVEAQKGYFLNPYFPLSLGIFARALAVNDREDHAAHAFKFFNQLVSEYNLTDMKMILHLVGIFLLVMNKSKLRSNRNSATI